MTYPPSRAYRTTVTAITVLSPHFTRITLSDQELVHFGRGGLDQRVKLFLPRADGLLPDVGLFAEPRPAMMEWYQAWRVLPDQERNPIRTYTVRSVRPWQAQIDIDFVLHGAEGPASAWAFSAGLGDELIVIGPDARSEAEHGGIEWQPGAARDVLLAGDETAVPAICAILESLDETYRGHAFLEVPASTDMLRVSTRSQVTVRWLARQGLPHGEALGAAVRQWGAQQLEPAMPREVMPPTGDYPIWEVPGAGPATSRYAWLAGEAGVITSIRRHLVGTLGMDRSSVAFMGYWKQGRPET